MLKRLKHELTPGNVHVILDNQGLLEIQIAFPYSLPASLSAEIRDALGQALWGGGPRFVSLSIRERRSRNVRRPHDTTTGHHRGAAASRTGSLETSRVQSLQWLHAISTNDLDHQQCGAVKHAKRAVADASTGDERHVTAARIALARVVMLLERHVGVAVS